MVRNSILAGLVAAVACLPAAAVEWEVEPSIDLAESYTDNLSLQPDGQEVDEFVTEVLPAIRINGIGKQFEVDFEYRLQGLFFSRQDELDEVLDYSRTRGRATLLGESLFIDFAGSLNQQIINPDGRIGISAVSQTGNRSEVGNFSVNPYFQRTIGSATTVQFGYNYGLVEYDDVSLSDSESNGYFATIAGGPPRSAWSWKLTGTDATIDYDSGAEVQLQRVGAEIAWKPGGKTAIFVGGGDENNEFNQLIGARKIDGAYWNVGLRGQLDKLTTFSISAGEEHFGDSYQFKLLREAGQLTTDISYLEETTTIGRQQQGYEALFQFLTNITGVELPSSGAEVYVRKRLSGVATLQLARSKLRLNVYDENRDYLTTAAGDSDGVSGAAVSWTWTTKPRNEFSVDLGWQRFELRTNSNNPEDVRFQVRFRREIRDGLYVNFRAWANSRFGTVARSEYDERAVSIGIGKVF